MSSTKQYFEDNPRIFMKLRNIARNITLSERCLRKFMTGKVSFDFLKHLEAQINIIEDPRLIKT